MAITISLGFNPMWYIADLLGRPLGGGTLEFFSSLLPTDHKTVYQDQAATIPWTNPIFVPLNGQLNQPIYFLNDSAIPGDNYYIVARDQSNNIVWSINDYFPSNGGGGGPIPLLANFKNYIKNNGFFRGENTANPIATLSTTLAPSVHSGLAKSPSLYGPDYQPDIYLSKNDLSAQDQITFNRFTPLGGVPFFPTDVTPIYYMHYECANTPLTETVKDIVIPVSQGVDTFDSQNVTFTIWARSISGATIGVSTLQYYGSGGGGSPPAYSAPGIVGNITIPPTNTWTKYVRNFTVPLNGGKTLGLCGDDFFAMVLRLPLNAVMTDFDVAKPSLYLGNVNPDTDYDTFDENDSVIALPRTGDFRTSANSFVPYGWVLASNNGIINRNTPVVPGRIVSRANIDTFPLFKLLWDIPTLPIYDVAGLVTARTNASADFVANKSMQLPTMSGRFITYNGVSDPGTTGGSTTASLAAANLPAHTHTSNYDGRQIFYTPGVPPQIANGASGTSYTTGAAFAIGTNPGGVAAPFSVQNPFVVMNGFMKL